LAFIIRIATVNLKDIEGRDRSLSGTQIPSTKTSWQMNFMR